MRRVVTYSLWFLAIGAILNVLVAFTCAALARHRTFDARLLGRLRMAQYDEEDRLAQQGITGQPQRHLSQAFVSRGTRLLMTRETTPDSKFISRAEHAAGWPMLALAAEQIMESGRTQIEWGARVGTLDLEFPTLPLGTPAPPGVLAAPAPLRANPPATAPTLTIAVAARQKADHLLPLRPLWLGFAVNTLAYAAWAWMLWLIARLAVAFHRRLCGRCGNCGYPIGTSPVCTECGRKVAVRAG